MQAAGVRSASEPFRILVLFGNVPLLGQELTNMNVLEAMHGAGSEVLFLIRSEWTRDTIQAELNRRGLPWVAVPYLDAVRRGQGLRVWINNVRGILGGSWQLLRWHRRFKPTHLHAGNPEHILNFLPALALLRTPLVYRVGDAPTLHHWLWRGIWRFTIRRASRFVPNSRYVESVLIASGVPSEKITRVSNVAPLHPVRGDDRTPLPPVRPDLCTFVYLGQLAHHKGVHLFVEAAINRCQASPRCRFLLAGDYSWNNAFANTLRSRVEQLCLADRIVFLGYVSEIPRLLGMADVHVCPSIASEPFGNVVIEAKQMGKPSVIFDSGGLVELVEHGIDGYVCPDKSTAALEEAFAFYEHSPDVVGEQGTAATRSLSRLTGVATFTEQWMAVYAASVAPTSGPKPLGFSHTSSAPEPKPKRIIAILGSVPLWGLELGSMDVMEAMRAAGSEVLFLIRGEWTRDSIQAELSRRGLPWVAVPYVDAVRRGQRLRVWINNVRGILGGSWQLLRWHRRFRPTHIYATNPEHILNFLPALALLRTPLVYRVGTDPTLHHWLWRAVWRFTIRKTICFVPISRYLESVLLASGVPAERITRISTVAPLQPVRGTSVSTRLPRARPDLLTFVYFGQLTQLRALTSSSTRPSTVVTPRPIAVFSSLATTRGTTPSSMLSAHASTNSASLTGSSSWGTSAKSRGYSALPMSMSAPVSAAKVSQTS